MLLVLYLTFHAYSIRNITNYLCIQDKLENAQEKLFSAEKRLQPARARWNKKTKKRALYIMRKLLT